MSNDSIEACSIMRNLAAMYGMRDIWALDNREIYGEKVIALFEKADTDLTKMHVLINYYDS